MKISAIGYKTDSGRSREENEDNLYANSAIGLFIVADGIGGHQGGKRANTIGVQTVTASIAKALSEENRKTVFQILQLALQEANAKIYLEAAKKPDLNGMGATIVLALCLQDKIYLAHAGDCRAYLIRESEITPLTQDHSIMAELLTTGKITKDGIRRHHLRHVVTRALGIAEIVEPDLLSLSLQKGDRFLLCTDGLTDMLREDEIKAVILNDDDIQQICENLVTLANAKGGEDNITVLLFKIED